VTTQLPSDATQRKGYSIRIFLAEGTPSGLKFVEKSNWTGLGVVCPRPRFSSVKERDEFSRAGVYLLLGPSESSDLPVAYIGEADPVRFRLEQHHSSKDFWTVAYFFTSKDTNLNKAHIEYLEHRLVALAKDAKRCKLENGNVPGKPSLSEADEADIKSFLEELLLCFPVLGVTIFERPESRPVGRQILLLKNKGITAQGYESEDGFVVRSGSTTVIKTVESIPPHALTLRQELLVSGILRQENKDFCRLTQDYEFSSPSTAAAVLIGASVNGRDWWKTADGTTLKQLQEKAAGKMLGIKKQAILR
jgi:hypothetical protein